VSGQVYSEPFAQVPEWLLDSDVSDRAIRVWAVLHRHANRKGHAFPGRAAIAERARCSTASVDRALNELRDVGAVVSENRFEGAAIVGNDYWLWPALPSSAVMTPSVTADATLAAPVTRQEREPTNESQELKPLVSATSGTHEQFPKESRDEMFEAFWKIYPRKTDKGGARKAFEKAVKAAGVFALMEGVQRFVVDPNLPEPQFIPHASTWLNGGRWSDGPLPPRAGQRGRIAVSESNMERLRKAAGAQSAIGR
jgi:hypothetical protein